jgi:endonuclease/exonuclease/phosphatase family metal-dependent hydrolase
MRRRPRAIQRLTELMLLPERARRPRDAWQIANSSAAGATMPSHAPVSRIGYMLVSDGFAVMDASLIGAIPDGDGFYPSDHPGVAATLRLCR